MATSSSVPIVVVDGLTVHSVGTFPASATLPSGQVITARQKEPLLLPAGYCVTHKHAAFAASPGGAVKLAVEATVEGAPVMFTITPSEGAPIAGSAPDKVLAAYYTSLGEKAPKTRPAPHLLWGVSNPVVRAFMMREPNAEATMAAEKAKMEAVREKARKSATGSIAAAVVEDDDGPAISGASGVAADDEAFVASLGKAAAKPKKTPVKKATKAKAAGAEDKGTAAGKTASAKPTPKKPRGKKAVTAAAAVADARCPECNLSMSLPCAITLQPHAAPAKVPAAAEAKAAPAKRRQKSLAEIMGATGKPAAEAPAKKPRGKKAAAAAAAAAAATAQGSATDPAVSVDSDDDKPMAFGLLSDVVDADVSGAASSTDEDDKPIAFGLIDPAVVAAVEISDDENDAAPKRKGHRAEGGGGRQRTLAEMMKGGKSGADALAAELAKPLPPRKAVPRPLLDRMSIKAAKEQFDLDGGLAVKDPQYAVANMSKQQAQRFFSFAFEFLGERAKFDLAKKRKAQLKKADDAAAKKDVVATATPNATPAAAPAADADAVAPAAEEAPEATA